MIKFKTIDSLLDNSEIVRLGIVRELRNYYDTEQIEGVESASEEEMDILQEIGSDEVLFDDCSIAEIFDVVNLLKKWQGLLNP